ncbi:MAG: ABC transporter ATP-binding protein [Acutalibacteraceae bacterium]|jgi:ATP-binding cassette subfamily B multidrug efflux pump
MSKRSRVVPRLLRAVGRQRGLLIGAVLCALTGSAAMLTAPRLIALAIDRIGAPNGPGATLTQLLALISLTVGAGCLLTWITALLANLAANRTVCRLRQELFEKLGRLPVKYFDSHSRGDMISRFTNDIDAVSDGLNQGIVQLVTGVITVVLTLAFMLTLDPRVTLVAVLVTPLCFLVGFVIARYGHRKFAQQTRVQGELTGRAEELVAGQRTVKAFGREAAAAADFGAINEELYRCGWKAQFASALVNPSTRFVNHVAYVLVGVFGILAGLTPGAIAGFLTYTAQFAKPFNEITAITLQLQLAVASAGRIFQVLDEDEQSPDGDAALPSPPQGRVRFEGVDFAYDPQKPLIRQFDLSVEPGTTVAIVGPTGAGKTTLVNLLMRFYETDRGAIYVDGQPVTAPPRDELRRRFGMVLQDTWLFAGTVRDNIAYGRPDATDGQIEAAARAAHAHSFIRRLPQGYDTLLAEDGGGLSQGQKQLLTIARAMLLDPPMLILDEATSSVDILTEQRIQKAFRRLMEGRTTFVIAHRLSTIRDADRILVLDHGNVVESGTHEELLRKQGFYYRLYNAQFASEESA